MFDLRLPERELHAWSERYDYATADLSIGVVEAGDFMRLNGHLERDHVFSSFSPPRRALQVDRRGPVHDLAFRSQHSVCDF